MTDSRLASNHSAERDPPADSHVYRHIGTDDQLTEDQIRPDDMMEGTDSRSMGMNVRKTAFQAAQTVIITGALPASARLPAY